MMSEDNEDDDYVDPEDDPNSCPKCGSCSPWRCYDATTDTCSNTEPQ